MAYSQDFRRKAVEAYEAGEGSLEKIAKDFRIGRNTLSKWVKRWREEKTLDHRTSPGRPQKLPDVRQKLLELVKEKPDAIEQEYSDMLFERYGVRIHKSVVGYHLRLMKLTQKKRHSERSNSPRTESKP